MMITLTLCREIDVPAEIELEAEVLFIPPFPGRTNCRNDDAIPPDPGECEVTNESELVEQLAAWFDHQKYENIQQLQRYFASSEFEEYVKDDLKARAEDAE